MSLPITRTPKNLADTLEAAGPAAVLSHRSSALLLVLLRNVDPIDGGLHISHLDLALRMGRRSPRTAGRALAELATEGLIDYTPGDRVGHGTDAVRVSYVRVWVEAVEVLIDAGRDYVRAAAAAAAAVTKARMRSLLDWRARHARRRAPVDNLADTLTDDERVRKPRSLVVDRQCTSPPGPGPAPGGRGAPDPYVQEICTHDNVVGKCPPGRKIGAACGGTQR